MTLFKEKKHKDFEELFRANYTRLYFYALNLINDQASAEDIVEITHNWHNTKRIVK